MSEGADASINFTGDEASNETTALAFEPAPPVDNRFLFVDIAAMRAKQLRRGARPRLGHVAEEAGATRSEVPLKLERVAMEEVRHGLIQYTLPDQKPAVEEAA